VAAVFLIIKSIHIRMALRRSRRFLAPLSSSEALSRPAEAPALATLPLIYERRHWAREKNNVRVLVGIDEAGRGPLAGPVVAAAVALIKDECLEAPPVFGVLDSKDIDEGDRERLFEALTRHPGIVYGVSVVDHEEIDRINILQATFRGMERAAALLRTKLQAHKISVAHTVVDGPFVPPGIRESFRSAEGIVRGDAKVYSIAAASIIAKVTRDRIMRGYDLEWPQYSFSKHKGYGVAAHVAAIREHGPCPIHRRTFAPLKNWFPVQVGATSSEHSLEGPTDEVSTKKRRKSEAETPREPNARARNCRRG
jgi:ribonuclease HII